MLDCLRFTVGMIHEAVCTARGYQQGAALLRSVITIKLMRQETERCGSSVMRVSNCDGSALKHNWKANVNPTLYTNKLHNEEITSIY
jgi:hypothetical protein